jgi:prepilin-type processing-associated H-X9-DG protein
MAWQMTGLPAPVATVFVWITVTLLVGARRSVGRHSRRGLNVTFADGSMKIVEHEFFFSI